MPASRGELFAGVTVAIVTPFAGGDIDWPGLAELIEWHVAQGTNALAPCGTTGESPTLTHDENEKIVAFVCEKAAAMSRRSALRRDERSWLIQKSSRVRLRRTP